MSVKTIWGKVVLYLKDHHEVALHVACGDLTDVELSNGKLIINVVERVILEEGKGKIERALRWQGLELEVEVRLKEVESSKAEKDIKKLKGIFEDVKIEKKKNIINWR